MFKPLSDCVVPDNIRILPVEGFWFDPHPLGHFSFCSYFSFQVLVFEIPPGLTNNPTWGGYGYFFGTIHFEVCQGLGKREKLAAVIELEILDDS